MRLYAVALITWAAFVTTSAENNIANLSNDKVVDYTEFHDLPVKQVVQPYVTDVEAKSSEPSGTEDRSDDFPNAGLSRSAVHAGEERGSNGVSTTDSSSPGSIYATPVAETSVRLETTDNYPFREYPTSHELGYTEDVLLVENAGSFGQKVRQNRPGDGTIIRINEDQRNDEYTSFQKPFSSSTVSLGDEDNRKRPYASATREPFVLALKESNLGDNSPSNDSKTIRSETSARNSDKVLSEVTTESSPPDNVASILENDVVAEILPTPQARLSRAHNGTADEKTAEKSQESTKKPENVVRTSTSVEISPSFQVRFSGPIVVADLPNRETQEMVVDYTDEVSEAYRPVGNTEITSEMTNDDASKVAASSSITSSVMLNPLHVGITLMNANQASLTDSEQSAAIDYVQDYPQQDLQHLATVGGEFVKNDGNQSRIDYQDENFEREIEKQVEVDMQKIPNNSVEIQKSIELYHTAPVHEIHYPPEYIQQTANLGIVETNNIGGVHRTKQQYDFVEQPELRPTYQDNDQDEKNVIKAQQAPTFSQKLNRHEYNVLEDDVGKPMTSAVGTEYSSNTYEQTPLELQSYKYNSIQPALLGPNQFDDSLYDQSNVRHNFNGNDNGTPTRAKPIGSSTRQETASEPVKTYVPTTYQYSVQHPQSNQPYDHQHQFRSPEIRRPEVQQLLLRIIPEGSSANGGFLVPLPRPYPIEKIIEKTVHTVPGPIEIEKKIPVERLVGEKKVQIQVSVPQPQPQLYVDKQIRLPHIYPFHIERVVEKRVPYTVQRLVVQPVQPPSYPLHVRLPAAYPAYPTAPIEQPAAHATVAIEKPTEKPTISSRPPPSPPRPYRANTDRPTDGGGGNPVETRFTKYYQKPQEAIFAETANLHGVAGGLTFVPQPQSATNLSQFYSIPYGRPSAYDNIDVGKNLVPTAHLSNIKLVILPKKFASHVILRPHTAAPSYAIPSFGRQIFYNLVEKDKTVKNEYVGPTPPRKISQSKVYPQTKSPQFSTSAAQSLATLRKSRQPETQHYGSFRQSKMEYGFKPPMVPSIQYDEDTASKVEN